MHASLFAPVVEQVVATPLTHPLFQKQAFYYMDAHT